MRFVLFPNTNLIKLTAKLDGSWGQNSVDVEQRLSPFTQGQGYEMAFLPTKRGCVIYVNGVYLITYVKTSSMASAIDTIFYKFKVEVSEISF